MNSYALSLLDKLNKLQQVNKLLPRRQEIYHTIENNSPCSADYLYGEFYGTPKSTIRYDLLQLQKASLIHKLGNTRGALYSVSLPE